MLEQSVTTPPSLELPDTRLEGPSTGVESRARRQAQISAGATPFILLQPLNNASNNTANPNTDSDNTTHPDPEQTTLSATVTSATGPLHTATVWDLSKLIESHRWRCSQSPCKNWECLMSTVSRPCPSLKTSSGPSNMTDETIPITMQEAPQGVDIRAGGGQGGICRNDPPQLSWDQVYEGPVVQTYINRPISPTPAGYTLNLADNYIPFHITDNFGHETPAKYVRIHWGNNPSAQARLTSDGVTYQGEVHTAPCNDCTDSLPPLTYEDLRLLQTDNQQHREVDAAVCRLKDLSLKAEIQQWRGMRE
jgi:hypothetical protein